MLTEKRAIWLLSAVIAAGFASSPVLAQSHMLGEGTMPPEGTVLQPENGGYFTGTNGYGLGLQLGSMDEESLLEGSRPIPADLIEAERVQRAVDVLLGMASRPSPAVPYEILDRAAAIVVVPSLAEATFRSENGLGAIMSVRSGQSWSAPTFINVTGLNLPPREGVDASDLVLLIMDRNTVRRLVDREFTLGSEYPIAPGPLVGDSRSSVRKAVSTGILAYGCWKGSFEGIGLGMVTIHPDPASIGRFYGRPLTAQEVLSNEKLAADYVPALANLWQDTLATLAD